MNTNYGDYEALREMRNEFNKNYKKFLEASLLESVIENAIQSSDQVENSDAKLTKLNDRIKEKYLKSNFISLYNNNPVKEENSLNEFSANDFKTLPLDLECKSHLVDKTTELLEARLNKIHSFMTDANDSQNNDYPETMRVFNALVEEIQEFKHNSEKSNDDLKLKYEHGLNIAFEVAKLLNSMLNNYRLGFYAEENKERCEHKILEFKTLLGKMLSSKTSILSDVYSEEKLKALKIISDQIDLKANMAKDKYERTSSLIKLYKSLGKDFEPILMTYKQLKEELERKNFTLNTLKKDNFI